MQPSNRTNQRLLLTLQLLHVMIHAQIPEQRFNMKCVPQRFVLLMAGFLRVSSAPVLPSEAYLRVSQHAPLNWRAKGKNISAR